MSYIFWLTIAVLLLIIEIAAPAFFFVFFSFSALVVAALSYFDVVYELAPQIGIFAIVAVLSLVLLRKKFRDSIQNTQSPMNATESFRLDADIPAKSEGRVTYQGSPWSAVNDTDADMKSGDTVIIARTEGVRLILRKPE